MNDKNFEMEIGADDSVKKIVKKTPDRLYVNPKKDRAYRDLQFNDGKEYVARTMKNENDVEYVRADLIKEKKQ